MSASLSSGLKRNQIGLPSGLNLMSGLVVGTIGAALAGSICNLARAVSSSAFCCQILFNRLLKLEEC